MTYTRRFVLAEGFQRYPEIRGGSK